MSDSRKVNDGDFAVHGNEIYRLNDQVKDFEDRLRKLEKFKNRQIGFINGNRLWMVAIGLTLLNLLNPIIQWLLMIK